MTRRLAVLLPLLLAACHLMLPLATREPTRDGSAPGDTRRADLSLADTAMDHDAPDGDQGAPLPHDSGTQLDLHPVDLGPGPDHGTAADGKPTADSGALAAACTGTLDSVYSSKTMVICYSPSQPANQCNAASLCGSGWHLCPASEFLARGGKTESKQYGAWLASCARAGGKVSTPTEAICGTCTTSYAKTESVAWFCDASGTFDLSFADIGVVTHTSCIRIGQDLAAWGAYWGPLKTFNAMSFAACCKD